MATERVTRIQLQALIATLEAYLPSALVAVTLPSPGEWVVDQAEPHSGQCPYGVITVGTWTQAISTTARTIGGVGGAHVVRTTRFGVSIVDSHADRATLGLRVYDYADVLTAVLEEQWQLGLDGVRNSDVVSGGPAPPIPRASRSGPYYRYAGVELVVTYQRILGT